MKTTAGGPVHEAGASSWHGHWVPEAIQETQRERERVLPSMT